MKIKNLIFILLLIISIGMIGITAAYFQTTSNADHEFKTSTLGATTYDTFVSPDNWLPGDTTEKILYVTNNGNEDIAVRISLEEEWKSKNNEILSNTQNNESIAIINLTHTSDWVKLGNYYYYKYHLTKNDSTSTFMKSITFNPNIDFDTNCITNNNINNCSYSIGDYDGATYNLNIKIETIDYDKYQTVWNPSLVILDSKPSTGAESLVEVANVVSITDYNDGDIHQMYTFEHSETAQTSALTDYRYIGNDPYNYVYFNCTDDDDLSSCEVWRIIGVFDVDDGEGNFETRIKLIRNSTLTDVKKWNENSENNWATATLNTYLNGEYLNSLSLNSQSMIDDTKYYLGGRAYDSTTKYGNVDDIYTWERSTRRYNSSRPTNWVGKVALMYPSDMYMVYANGIDNKCYSDPNSCTNTNSDKGWIYNSNKVDGTNNIVDTWLISPFTGYNNNVFQIYASGKLDSKGDGAGGMLLNFRPVVYLSSDVRIDSGTGASNDPYVLSI